LTTTTTSLTVQVRAKVERATRAAKVRAKVARVPRVAKEVMSTLPPPTMTIIIMLYLD